MSRIRLILLPTGRGSNWAGEAHGLAESRQRGPAFRVLSHGGIPQPCLVTIQPAPPRGALSVPFRENTPLRPHTPERSNRSQCIPCQAPFDLAKMPEPFSFVASTRHVRTYVSSKQYFVRPLFASGDIDSRPALSSEFPPHFVIGVASVAMQTQVPFLFIQVSIKRSRRVTILPFCLALTAITPMATAVLSKTRTVSDSGATCS